VSATVTVVTPELTHGQATHYMPKGGTISPHLVKKTLRARWNLAPQRMPAKSCVHFAWRHPAPFVAPADVIHPSDNQLKVIGATKTPFAVSDHCPKLPFPRVKVKCLTPHSPTFQVKSGGHIMNPGFSSTVGIQIYTGKFSQVTYDPTSGTVIVGSGLIWDTVYQRLQEHNVTVVGGRVTGVSGRRDSIGRATLNTVT